MRKFLSYLLIIAAIAGSIDSLSAQTAGQSAVLEFENGDRLQGVFLGRDDSGNIFFSTPYLGELTVAEHGVSLLLEPGEEHTSDPTQHSREDSLDVPDDPPTDESGESEETRKWQRTDVPGLTWIRYPANWSGRLRFSFDFLKSARNSNRFNFDNQINIRRESDRFEIQGRYEYEQFEDAIAATRDRYDARLRYDHDVSERNFFQSETIYAVDRVRLIDHQVRQTIGYGFLWNGEESYELQIVPGLAGSYLDQFTPTAEENWLLLGRLLQSFKYRFSENYALTQSFEGFIRADDPDNYELKFRIGFISSLTRKLAFELDYEYDLDNTVDSPLNRVDTRLRANIVLQY